MDNKVELNPQLVQELRDLLAFFNGEKTWQQFPDHVVVFYAKSYLANKRNEKYGWYKRLQEIFIDQILLEGPQDVP